MRVFNFKKTREGKWKPYLNGKTAFYFFQTYGLPKECYAEEINEISSKRKSLKIGEDFISYAKENNISLKELKNVIV